MMRILTRVGAAMAVVALALGLFAGTSSANHSGEAIQVSKTSGLSDGETVAVTLSGFVPGGNDGQHPNAKLVIAGQGDFSTIPDKLNFEEYASAIEVVIQPDGTGVGELLVYADHGTQQDGTQLNCNTDPCWIVAVQEPFLPQPNYATVPITFGGAAPAPAAPAAAAPAAPKAATPAAPVTTAPPAPTAAVAPETTIAAPTTVAPTTTVATTTTAPKRVETAAAASVADSGTESSVLFGIIAVLASLIAGGGFLATRKKDWTPPGAAPV